MYSWRIDLCFMESTQNERTCKSAPWRISRLWMRAMDILNNFVSTAHVADRSQWLFAHPVWLYKNCVTLRNHGSSSSLHLLSTLFEHAELSHQSAVQRFPRPVKVSFHGYDKRSLSLFMINKAGARTYLDSLSNVERWSDGSFRTVDTKLRGTLSFIFVVTLSTAALY